MLQCYIYIYIYIFVIHFRSSSVQPCYPGYFFSYAMLSYNATYQHVSLSYTSGHQKYTNYPGYSIAMLCYVTMLHIYLYHTLQVIKYTPPLSWLCWVRSAPPPPLPSFMSGRRSFILRWSGMSEWAPVPRVPV